MPRQPSLELLPQRAVECPLLHSARIVKQADLHLSDTPVEDRCEGVSGQVKHGSPFRDPVADPFGSASR